MSAQIHDATKNDVEDLISIYSAPHLYHNRKEASWFVKCFFEYHHIKLVKLDGKIIGALLWKVMEERHHGLANIEDLWIDENFRRRGLGEKLLRTVIQDMKKNFAKDNFVLRKILVSTAEDNEAARKLYEKAGFNKSALIQDLSGPNENELLYILTLNP